MKAVLFEKHGGPEVLHLAEVPDPTAGPGEVVVDIHAASVNAADYKVRLGGGAYSGGGVKLPHILGRDFSGVVSAVGPGVTDLQGRRRGVRRAAIRGSRAPTRRRSRSRPRSSPRSPTSLGDAEAAAMALTSLTALWALEDTAKLKAGETILIQGGAGGVAGFRDPARQASRRDGDHDGERPQPRLCAPPRRRPGHRLQHRGFHEGGRRL